jgi:hypothetical protein
MLAQVAMQSNLSFLNVISKIISALIFRADIAVIDEDKMVHSLPQVVFDPFSYYVGLIKHL